MRTGRLHQSAAAERAEPLSGRMLGCAEASNVLGLSRRSNRGIRVLARIAAMAGRGSAWQTRNLLRILKRGTAAWKAWRREHRGGAVRCPALPSPALLHVTLVLHLLGAG